MPICCEKLTDYVRKVQNGINTFRIINPKAARFYICHAMGGIGFNPNLVFDRISYVINPNSALEIWIYLKFSARGGLSVLSVLWDLGYPPSGEHYAC
jgi:hypothetical protein